ncbi:unnamed protein product [Medioppia subpectinata]|uniref:Elongation of very long chain fatty acids protein n=1 Tax=Medioppia subpectinata TaxID=1979941 RepID=A0A7R9KT59_9ACAR|nr:unnamed protein product [Medioppia subpectinata]CAG2108147.1 unnamed protein product [Medioppia subpectinata]
MHRVFDKQVMMANNGTTYTAKIHYILHQYWVDETDDKIKPYVLLGGGPELFVTLMLLWLIFVVKLGPNIMVDQKPFVLRKTLMVYNLMLVFINVYFAYTAAKWLDYGFKSWVVRLPARNKWSDKAVDELPDKIIYFYTKLFDLFDTIFFVLRRKSTQISFLHVYHHFLTPILAYMVLKLCPQTVIFEIVCFVNSIVHTVMYSYYLVSSFGPWIQPYLWWKRYITRIQLLQFVIYGLALLISIYYGLTTDYPIALQWLATWQPFMFFYMFYRFYVNSYNKDKMQ